MTFIVDGTSGLTFPDTSVQAVTATNATNITSGTLPFGRLPSGSVLQVVQSLLTTSTSTTSSSYVTSGLTASITPKFSTSKIFILLSAQARSDANKWLQTALFKNGSLLNKINEGLHYVNGSTITTQLSYSFLDSPATTSSTTYALYFNSQASGTVSINIDSAVASIILMEIAA
jgi:hypothetical protein